LDSVAQLNSLPLASLAQSRSLPKQREQQQQLQQTMTTLVAVVSLVCAALWSHALFERLQVIPLSSPSQVTRETVLFSENAFYYAHYADALAAPNLSALLHTATHDARSEFGHEINALQRFNLFPELFLALAHRLMGQFADRFRFYYTAVALAFGVGVAAKVFFVAGIVRRRQAQAESSVRGVLPAIAVVLLLTSAFVHYSRLELHIALRENFGVPAFFLVLAALAPVLDAGRLSVPSALALVGATTLFLLVWQFATFLMFTLVGCLAVVYAMQLLSRALLLQILALFGTALAVFALLMFGSSPMYTYRSLFFVVALGLAVSATAFGGADDRSSVVAHAAVFLRRIFGFAIVTVVVFTALKQLTTSDDDGHIFDVLLVRLGLKPHGDRFHIRIYTTQAEFDGPAWTLIESMFTSGVIPAGVVGALAAVWRFRELRASEMLAIGMSIVAVMMFLLMMRFQVLATPLVISTSAILCGPFIDSFAESALAILVGSTGGSKPASGVSVTPAWTRIVHGALVVALFATLANSATRSLRSMWDLDFAHNTFQDPGDSGPQLCRWVRHNADRSVFATDMVTSSLIRLCSNASVICHPQYEDARLRARVREVYELFGARDLPYLYNIARKVRADFVILHKNHCAHKVGDGSRFLSVIDRDWEAQGNALGPDSLCETAFDYHTGRLPYFDLVHQTKHHWVLRVRAPNESPSSGAPSYIERLKRGRDPTDGYALCSLAQHAQDVLHDHALSQQLYTAALASLAPDAMCLSLQARQFEQNAPMRAHELYRKSLELEPWNPEVLSNYAIFLDEAGDERQRIEAGALYRRAIQHGRSNPTYYGNYAIYLEINRDERAAEQYELAAVSAMCDSNTLCAYSIYLFNRKQTYKAQVMMQRAGRRDPNNACFTQHRASVGDNLLPK
jgi:Tfp pilus assembly protein PilF